MIENQKTELRAEMKRQRGALSAVERAQWAEQLAAVAFVPAAGHPWRRAVTVSGYLPIRDELDPRPLMQGFFQRGADLCLPVMHGRDQPLEFRSWAPGDAMATVAWGIQEPMADKATLLPDLVLVPLLAVDRAGNRLGYGAGHYDRTIAALRRQKPVITVALAFDCQVIDAVPHSDYDERLDWIATPRGVVPCRQAPSISPPLRGDG